MSGPSRLAALAFLATAAAAPAARAQDVGVIRWQGSVDREVELEFQDDEVSRRSGSGGSDRVRMSAPLPGASTHVFARTVSGRALVAIDEAPSRYNDYTATVVVVAEGSSRQDVELELLWIRDLPSLSSGSGGSGWGSSGDGSRESMRWRGVVDGADDIHVQAGDVTVSHLSHLPIQSMDYKLTAPLPRAEIDLELRVVRGRGKVRLLEAPRAANQYRATVRVDDSDERGADTYEFELVWEAAEDTALGSGGPEDVLEWSGRVDGTAILVVRGDSVTVEHVSGRPVFGDRHSFTAPLPARDLVVNIRKNDGRGRAVIEGQPTRANGYTLRVRIEDPKSGSDTYKLELSWPAR